MCVCPRVCPCLLCMCMIAWCALRSLQSRHFLCTYAIIYNIEGTLNDLAETTDPTHVYMCMIQHNTFIFKICHTTWKHKWAHVVHSTHPMHTIAIKYCITVLPFNVYIFLSMHSLSQLGPMKLNVQSQVQLSEFNVPPFWQVRPSQDGTD